MFELVSCPHYFAEIVIYCGLLAATGGKLLPLLMLVWVVSAALLGVAAKGFWGLALRGA
jgi:3-oxo-5-alpha-steroid 4-dehydrogenase 3